MLLLVIAREICEAAVAGAASDIELVAADDGSSRPDAPHATGGSAKVSSVARTRIALITAILPRSLSLNDEALLFEQRPHSIPQLAL